MDAAVDAMAKFGFPEAKVEKHVKLLLQVYGGADGWPFIEECTYRELLEAMLRDVEEEQEDVGTSTIHEGPGATTDEEPGDDSSPANIALAPSSANTQPESSGANNALSRTDENISGMSTLQPANSLPPAEQLPPCYGWIENDDMAVQPANSLPPHGHKPCYNRIESDDIEDGSVYLKPMPGHFGEKGEASMPPNDRTGSREKRRSRWDLKPEDP